ncbi:hypothetical protein BU17DRAFT_62703 [Hysterangium stoloniferum]|nr:hypothetical protein BU17DRAFT_62703 [Hysterangium stoloniferum]
MSPLRPTACLKKLFPSPFAARQPSRILSPKVSPYRALATVSDAIIIPDPSQKYQPYSPVNLPDRKWPSAVLRSAPIWLSTDLRDGNQALPNPMTIEQKLKFFAMLVQIGFKEIEIAYPSASETEHKFTRSLIEDNLVPDDVWLQVLTPCRPELIKKTMESVAGAKNVILHMYLGTARVFREVVFQKSCAETIDMAVKGTALVRDLVNEYGARYGTNFRFAYGVEGFSQAEPDFVVDLCEEVKRTWGKAGPGNNRMTVNLAASVEVAPPNHFADQVEYFCRRISEREKLIVSLHPHNDMGTAVAAAQLALLAGADRVEGCLLGHGERTGNVDLITMALNQFTQGISPRLDFSNLPHIINVVKECTGLPVNPRLPYSGQLAFTAFSGSHQDAIRKGFQEQEKRHQENRSKGEPQRWSIPYLPFDPADIGCSYEAMIRVNSQSGKAGVATVLDQALSLQLPRGMQAEFYQLIQKEAERTGTEVSIRTIVRIFRETYRMGLEQQLSGYVVLRSCRVSQPRGTALCSVDAEIQCDGALRVIQGSGPNPQAALLSALGNHFNMPLAFLENCEHKREATREQGQEVAHYIKISLPRTNGEYWGIGTGFQSEQAGMNAVISAVNAVMDSLDIRSNWTPDYSRQNGVHRQIAAAM